MQKMIHRRGAPEIPRALSALDPLLQRIYATRGICEAQELDRGLAGLPHPNQLLGIDAAVTRLLHALKLQQRVVVVGDFDADGATSSALMVMGLRAMGFQSVRFLVPNRFEFGYGLTPEIVVLASAHNPDLILTVDNGMSSVAGVVEANRRLIDVVITDHHLPGDALPAACAIVNPNQLGCSFPSKNLAGVGVTFYLLTALRTALREVDGFLEQGIAEPNIATWLDLVALGTVADVVPLDRVNRILIHQGLLRIRRGYCRPGIAALLRVAGKNPSDLVASDLGFAIGPRLNAAGRLDDMSVGIHCLLTEDAQEALVAANQLDALNRDRKVIEQGMQEEAKQLMEQLDVAENANLPSVLCLFQPDWHEGVVGLLASRIKDQYQRPVVAFARQSVVQGSSSSSQELKGSCRSIPKLHIRDALDAVATRHPTILTKFGGHAMAAGLSIAEEHYGEFVEALTDVVTERLTATDFEAVLVTDGMLAPEQLSLQTALMLRAEGPWGQQFSEPVFDGSFFLLEQRLVADRHLKLVIAHPAQPNQRLDAIQFNIDPEDWPNAGIKQVECVYRLDINDYKGLQKLQLIIDYLAPTAHA